MDGSLVRHGKQCRIQFERDVEAPVARVWEALTEPGQRADWFFAGRLDVVEGGVVELTDSTGEKGIRGRVLAMRPERLLEFTWTSVSAPSESIVRFELASVDGTCRLSFRHTLEQADDLAAMMAGWHCHLDALPQSLSGDDTAWPNGKWPDLRSHYAELLNDEPQT